MFLSPTFRFFFSFILPFLPSSHHTIPEVVVDPLPLPKCEVGVPLETVEGVDLELREEWDIEMVGATMHNKDHMVVTPGGMEGGVDTSQEEEEEEEVRDQTIN